MTNLTVFFAMILVVQTTYLEDVKNFTEIFATFKNDSTDLEKLIAIAENHQELAEQATKVGLLFAAAGGNNSSEPGSDEDQALEYLNNEIRRKFDILNIKRRDDRVPFSYSLYNNAHNDIIRPIWYNYQKDVSDVLELFYYDYSYSEDFFVNFGMNKEKCENPDFTQKHRFMTLRLNRAYYSGSNDIYQGMKDDIRKYVRLQQAIREAESRVKKRTSENPETIEELLDDVKARIMTFGLADDNTRYTSNDGRIQILENINPETLDDLLKELLYFSVRFPRMIPIYDLLREDRFYGFKKPDLMYAVQDLLKYQWSTIACTATKTGYSTSYIGKRISADAKEVAKVAQDYVTYYQSIGNITWPEIHVEAAKRAIGFDRIPLEKFNKTASRIQKELGKYLPEGYSYQILITEARQKDVYWVAESKTGDYAYFTDLNGIDCHIFRYRILGASERVNNATEHFEQHRQDLKNILEKSAYSESATEVMQELLQTVDFFNNEAYNSAILLRNEAFFVNNSKIYAGEAFLETNNTNSVEFSVNSFYKTAPLIMAGLLQIVLHARKQDVHMSFPSIFGKMPKFPLIVFGALFFVVQATYLEDVKKFTEIFATFKNDSTDMEKLETMAGIHEKLLKYAVPVGFLLATGINKTFSPGSDGDQALQYLNNELTKKFKLLKMKFQDDRAPFRYYVYYSAYADIIQSGWRYYQRDVSERLYKWYYDYGITKDFFVNFEKYGRKCSGDFYDRASYLLMDLYRGRGCLIYEDMKDHILKYVGTQRAVREAESRVKNRTSENPDGLQELLQDVRDRIWTYSSSDEPWMYPRHKMRSQLLNEINPETLDDLLKELLYFLARFPKRGPSCELYRENFFYGFKKPDLLYAVQDLLKYQWMQMACAAVDASNNPGSFGYRIRTYAIELAAIAGKYATYYRSIENLTWPEIHVEAAKRAIGFDKISPKKFNKTAGIIQKELEKYMPDGYSFQVLITETRQKNVYWVAESKTDDYVRFTDLNGIDCHIFRYRTLGASEQAKNATAYFQLHHQALKNILENAVYSTDMRGVMKQLLQAVDFNNNSACNSAILLRNEAFFVKNLKIRTGVASLENNTNSVEFSINQFYKTARAWKFYLFI